MAQMSINTDSGKASVRTYVNIDGESTVSIRVGSGSSLFMPRAEAKQLVADLLTALNEQAEAAE